MRESACPTEGDARWRTKVRKTLRKLVPLPLVLAVSLPLFGFSSPAVSAAPASSPRPMEYLTRGLVAAQTSDGIFLSWRFLGNEPDGISWNVYRKDGNADFVKITTIAPRDVQPESDYATNPGIVKEDVTLPATPIPAAFSPPSTRSLRSSAASRARSRA